MHQPLLRWLSTRDGGRETLLSKRSINRGANFSPFHRRKSYLGRGKGNTGRYVGQWSVPINFPPPPNPAASARYFYTGRPRGFFEILARGQPPGEWNRGQANGRKNSLRGGETFFQPPLRSQPAAGLINFLRWLRYRLPINYHDLLFYRSTRRRIGWYN